MTLNRRLLSIALCTTLLGLTACSDDDDADATSTSEPASSTTTTPPSTSPPSSSTPTTTTTSTTSSTLVTVTTAPSTLDPTTPIENEDWVAVLQQLVNLRDELYATSDPTRAGEVCADGAFCYDQLVAQLTDAQSKGWRVVDQGPITIVSAELENYDAPDGGPEVASVQAVIRRTEQHGRIVDASGNTVFDLVPEDPDAPLEGVVRWILIRTSSGWRILDQETIS